MSSADSTPHCERVGIERQTGDRAGDAQSASADDIVVDEEQNQNIDRKSFAALAAQHFAGSWDTRLYEFLAYVLLIVLFPDDLVPASIFGFVTTGAAVCLSGSVGQLVDTSPRLQFVRRCIIIQKATIAISYALFLVLFLNLKGDSSAKTWTIFATIVVCSSLLGLATIGISVSIERDWVTTISQGSSAHLTFMNVWMRRIDLVCKLSAPLFASALAAGVSYPFAIAFLLGYSLVSCAFQFWFLSFDGTMISWLKSHGYSDAFIAGMRGLNVVTGLAGTALMPLLEKRIGLVRAGTWSMVSEVCSLVPVVLSFFIDRAPEGQKAVWWNQVMLFAGMALSRIGLWAFDLCQLKLLQVSLEQHPRRNALTALQFSLQNILDLLK
ncbi:hypothetical protein OIO90_005782 [Microbotryomycetes sp. JL221]|nr:hypothetical protein OIO90_005782 [Microbotryomycetes sp. JL221]